jgi:hypothetical protein
MLAHTSSYFTTMYSCKWGHKELKNFQYDDAPPHYGNTVHDALDMRFPDQEGLFSACKSPDLMATLIFSFWVTCHLWVC